MHMGVFLVQSRLLGYVICNEEVLELMPVLLGCAIYGQAVLCSSNSDVLMVHVKF
jgi:hypothetical protein